MSKVIDDVMADLQFREHRGIQTYGTTVDRTDLTEDEWLQHLYEEQLDSVVYLKKIILTRNGRIRKDNLGQAQD